MTMVFSALGAVALMAQYTIPNSSTNAGGGSVLMTGGEGYSVMGSMGVPGVTSMSGGAYTVAPGVIASQRAPKPDVSLVHAYPVPFIPSRGHAQIVFTSLPAGANIYVYTIAGELVKKFVNQSGTDELQWAPVENEAGEGLASGVYIFVAEGSDKSRKTGKLMVIK